MDSFLKPGLLLLAVVALFLFYSCRGVGANQDETKQWIQEGAKIFDVRTPGEYSSGHYAKAKNIPLSEVQSRLSEFGPKDKKIIVYCQSGNRSGQAKKILEANGFTQVLNGGGLRNMP